MAGFFHVFCVSVHGRESALCGGCSGFGADSRAGEGPRCGMSPDLRDLGCYFVACGLSGFPRKQGECDVGVKNFGVLVHFPLAGFGWWA